MAGNRNSGMCSPLCSGVCAFYLPPRYYTVLVSCAELNQHEAALPTRCRVDEKHG